MPVLLPSIRDPRLHTASVLLTVQLLGQVSIGFELSIAQLLLSIGTCAAIEVVVVLRRSAVLAWPASAMLTGNGIALLLRVNGTEHGDWWSLRGWWIFVGTAALAMTTKYLIRVDGRHLFNPSNVALVAAFLVLGTSRVNPQDLWWGPWSVGLALVFILVIGGGVAITRRLHLLATAVGFWVTYAAGIAVLAVVGQSMRARWSFEPVDGRTFWWVLVTSPEILIFLFFMITDPRTVPLGRPAMRAFGVLTGALAVLLVSLQHTEFQTKVAIISALTITTLARPAFERALPVARGAHLGRRRAAALAAMAVALVGLGGLVAHDRAPGAASASSVPSVEVGTLPEVVVGDDLGTVNSSLDGEDVARDLLTSLELERRAVDAGDADLARVAVAGRELDATLDAIEAGDPAAPVPEFERLVVDLVRPDEQALPLLGVVATVREAGREVERTYVLERRDGRHLVTEVHDAG